MVPVTEAVGILLPHPESPPIRSNAQHDKANEAERNKRILRVKQMRIETRWIGDGGTHARRFRSLRWDSRLLGEPAFGRHPIGFDWLRAT